MTPEGRPHQRRKLQAILVDLDNTLYPPECGLLAAGDERITAFIQARLGLPREEADEVRRRLWREHGTTARGLAVEFGIPEAEMCREALESLDPQGIIAPDPELGRMLREIGVPVYLFTNSTRGYATRVLDALGVRETFAGIFDLEFLEWEGKPEEGAFRKVLEALEMEPQGVALADDHAPNLAVAWTLGMVTVAVGVECPADFRVREITELAGVLRLGGLL